MPIERKSDGDQPMTNAERQARYRARHAAVLPTASIIPRPTRSIDRRSRPKRWKEAVAVLLTCRPNTPTGSRRCLTVSTTVRQPRRSTLSLTSISIAWPNRSAARIRKRLKGIRGSQKSPASDNPNQRGILDIGDAAYAGRQTRHQPGASGQPYPPRRALRGGCQLQTRCSSPAAKRSPSP